MQVGNLIRESVTCAYNAFVTDIRIGPLRSKSSEAGKLLCC